MTLDELLSQQGQGVTLDRVLQQQPAAQVIGTFRDNGRVIRNADGSLQAVSNGAATNDPEAVQRIMAGDDFAAIVQDSVDQQRIAENPVAARVNEFVRGTPFAGPWLDEAVGVVSPEARDNMRATTGAMQRQHPGQTAALNIGGAVAGSVPMALAAGPGIVANAPATRAGQVAAGTGLGMVGGGLEGVVAGAGEGTTPQERQSNAVVGGGIGAGTGAVLGAVTPLAIDAVRAIVGRLRNSDVAVIASELGISRTAATQVRNALQSGDDEAARVALERAGAGGMLAEAGQPARELLDASAQAGGAGGQIARNAVEQRVNDASSQMTGALDRAFGTPQGEREMIDAIRSGSQPARSAAYDAAYSRPINYAEGPGRALERTLDRVPASAVRRANEIMRARGEESAQIMIRERPDGAFSVESPPDVRQWHYIMQGLDDVIKQTDGQGAMRGQTTLGSSYQGVRSNISRLLQQAVPEFGEAQSVAADAIRRQDATEFGYGLMRPNTRREDVGRQVADATQAERQAMGQGVRAYIDETTANVRRAITDPNVDAREGIQILRDFSSRANQAKIRMLLGQERGDALLNEIDRAATAFELRSAIAQNSRTAVRQSIQSGVNDAAQGGMVRTLMQGEPINATKRLVQAMTGETAEAQEIRRLGLYEEIARALTATQGDRARTALRHIQTAISREGEVSTGQARVIADILTSGSLSLHQSGQQYLAR